MRDEIVSRVSSQEMDTSVYQLPDPKKMCFTWKTPTWLGIESFNKTYTLAFSLQISSILRWVQLLKNPISFWEKNGYGNSPLKTADSEWTNEHCTLLGSHLLKTRTEYLLDHVFRSVFEENRLWCMFFHFTTEEKLLQYSLSRPNQKGVRQQQFYALLPKIY